MLLNENYYVYIIYDYFLLRYLYNIQNNNKKNQNIFIMLINQWYNEKRTSNQIELQIKTINKISMIIIII